MGENGDWLSGVILGNGTDRSQGNREAVGEWRGQVRLVSGLG